MAFDNYYDLNNGKRPATTTGTAPRTIVEPSQNLRPDTNIPPGTNIEVYELTEFIYKFAKDAQVDLEIQAQQNGKLTYHDPCHDLKILKVENEPRHFMKQFGKDFVDDKSALCCGFGGIFSVGFPSTSKKILEKKKGTLDELGAGTVVTSCPGCYYQLRENLPQDVKFFIELF
jgi:Fe-S oxidoreductase